MRKFFLICILIFLGVLSLNINNKSRYKIYNAIEVDEDKVHDFVKKERKKAEKMFHTELSEKIKKDFDMLNPLNKHPRIMSEEKAVRVKNGRELYLITEKNSKLILKVEENHRILWAEISPSYKYVIYADNNGGDFSKLVLFDIENKKEIEVKEHFWNKCGTGWLDDTRYFYTTKEGLRYVLYLKTVGTSNDKMIYKSKEEASYVTYKISESKKWLAIFDNLGTSKKTKVFFYNIEREEFKPFVNEYKDNYSGFFSNDILYIRTNEGNAYNYKILKVNPETLKSKAIIENDDKHIIEAFGTSDKNLVFKMFENVSHQFYIYYTEKGTLKNVGIPEGGTVTDYKTVGGKLYIYWTSYLDKGVLYSYTEKEGLKKESEIKIKADIGRLRHELLFYSSFDGTQIPINIIYRDDMKFDGNNPLILYGYGGFRMILFPQFSSFFNLWALKGGIYAVVHLRGGGEYGDRWYKAGAGKNKNTTFRDFHYAMQFLIDKGYTSKEKLGIIGSSQGGLLTSVAVTRDADMIRSAVIGTPLTDMLNYTNIKSGKYWTTDYGDPANEENLKNILTYSPYHNIKKAYYPDILIKGGVHDSLVGAIHAEKFAMKLKENNLSKDRDVYLYMDPDKGHSMWKNQEMLIEFFVKTLGFDYFKAE